MYELHRTRRGHRKGKRRLQWCLFGFCDSFRRGEDEHRPQPFAAREQAVSHGLGQLRWGVARGGKITFERRIDCFASPAEPLLKVSGRGLHLFPPGSPSNDAGAARSSPRSFRISMRFSADSSLAWQ